MKPIFAPGCALILYKNHLVQKLHDYLGSRYGELDRLLTCCRHIPRAAEGHLVINVCPGCNRRYRTNYRDGKTISVFELLAECDDFPFPGYEKRRMTISDACPARGEPRIHNAVRKLAARMNIEVIEPEETREKSVCCGDSFFESLPPAEVLLKMKARAASLPADEAIVYCVSCLKSLTNGGKKPRYLVDLLFGEETVPGVCDPVLWHRELESWEQYT